MRASIALFFVSASAAQASGVITFLTSGIGVDLLPIGASRLAGDEFQQVYDSAQFGGGPVTIYSIAFSSSAPTGGTDATSLSGAATLTLSTTGTLTPGGPGTWSPSNEGADQQTVFSGSFSTPVLHNSTFDIIFNLSTAFTFNPSAGNLLLDFDWTSTPSTNGFLGLSASFSSPLVGSNSNTAQFGSFGASDTGVATQFGVTPEPGTWLLAFSTLAAGVLARNAKIQKG